MSVQFKTVDEFSQDQRLDNFLLKNLKGVPKSHIYRIIRKGEVRVNKGRKKAAYKLQLFDVVRIPPVRVAQTDTVQPSQNLRELLKNAVIFEDDALLILNKPSGIAVHSGSGVSVGVIEVFKALYREQIELVHRLDRATSGVLLLAKKRSALKHLHRQLANNQIEKRYQALVRGIWQKKRHTLDVPLLNNSRYTVVDARGRQALSHFQPLKNFSNGDFHASLVEVLIETGRTHQIRAHAKYAGHPLAFDDKYGDPIFNAQVKEKGLRRLFLHAQQLTFTHPVSGEIQQVRAPLCAELADFLALL